MRNVRMLGEQLISCDLFRVEVRNSFWKYVVAQIMSEECAQKRAAIAIDYVDTYIPIEELSDEAFLEAIRHKHPVYDMLYFCLARRKGATLMTLDKKLAKLCQDTGVNCIEEVALYA
ncbi:type II toxin-antitoxin system VapC family toxin [Adlercreutzia sp. ZJ138]|uniref:type II toxin-antitoxin system VapC family toxin n=1 Tax=Adlercreutzia sp. ZJ138 TaxID=2709405 RepID=UPI001F14B0FA|nr:type II toxin-antitoxin system VapC family toxin [Adlercreutzia sp. ZJ138]